MTEEMKKLYDYIMDHEISSSSEILELIESGEYLRDAKQKKISPNLIPRKKIASEAADILLSSFGKGR